MRQGPGAGSVPQNPAVKAFMVRRRRNLRLIREQTEWFQTAESDPDAVRGVTYKKRKRERMDHKTKRASAQAGKRRSGFTRIPNFLLDEVMPRVAIEDFRVLLFFYRRTEGWQKRRDRISLSQIQEGANVCRDKAISAGELWHEVGFVRRRPGIGLRGTMEYEIVGDYDPKVITSRLDRLIGQNDQSARATRTGRRRRPELVGQADIQKKIKKGEGARAASQHSHPRTAHPSLARQFQLRAEEAWRDAHGGRKPTWHRKDFTLLARIVHHHPEMTLEELEGTWENFLRSDDAFIVKRGSQPADFLRHFDRLRDGPILAREQRSDAARREVAVGRFQPGPSPSAVTAPKTKITATEEQRRLARIMWDEFKASMKERLNPHTFSTWITPTRGICAIDGELVVEAPNIVFVNWLQTDGAKLITDVLRGRASKLKVRYLARDGYELEEPVLSAVYHCGCRMPHATREEHREVVLARGRTLGFWGRRVNT